MTRGRLAAVAAGVLAIAALAWALLWFTPLAAVRDIEVEGVVHDDPARVIASAAVDRGDRLARVDTAAAALEVAGRPWVARATVSRSWPSTLRIEVEENVPALFVREPDGEHLLTPEGEDFITAPPPEGVPELVADDPSPETARAALAIVSALPDDVRAAVGRAEARGPNEVQLVLRDGRTVYVGSADDAADKGLAVRAVLNRDPAEGGLWNVSDPRHPTVR